MQKSRVIVLCLLALVLSGESAHQRLKSLNDLKEIDFGQSVPKHSLLLLYWFAHEINIDHDNTITSNFNPNKEFGSHHYGNYEGILNQPPRGYQYYSVGNLFEETSSELPDYIRNPQDRTYNGRNRDRIIFSAERQTWYYRIDQVYLTQHIPSTNLYDGDHTYQISINLLREIRQLRSPTALWERLSSQLQGNIRGSQNTFNFEEQRRFTRDTFPSFEGSSYNRGHDETCGFVFQALFIVIMLIFVGFIVINAPKK